MQFHDQRSGEKISQKWFWWKGLCIHPSATPWTKKGTILYQQSIFNETCKSLCQDEESAPIEAGLDISMNLDSDEEDEEQAMLASMSQAMPNPNQNDDSPMMQKIVSYMSRELILGKNLDVLAYWKQHAKQFPLLAKVI